MRKEDSLAQQVATYLNYQYPSIVYHFDTGSGGTTSIGMAMRNKRLNKWKGYPDLFIAYPNSNYNGLFLELKADTPYKKDGKTLKKNEHIEHQNDLLLLLKYMMYKAEFGVGFESCKNIIDEYLKP